MIKRKTGLKSKNVQINFADALSEIKKGMYSHVAKSLENGFTEIVRGTPVKSGYAKSNWIVISDNVIGPTPLPKVKDKIYLDESSVIERGTSFLKILKKNGFGEQFRFYNGTPYIGYLENSQFSTNAFWIRRSIAKMRNDLSENRRI
jgi:hypothetical protein